MLHFIDIHGHYAWQIDDGIPTVEEAKRALALAKAQNIQTIIAGLFMRIVSAVITSVIFALIMPPIINIIRKHTIK